MNNIPTTKSIYEALEKDLRAKLDLPDDQFRRVLNAVTSVFSAQFKLAYLRVQDVQRNLFPDTADLAENGGELERLGRIHLNRNPNPATAGVYTVSVVGENGASIRSGLTFKSNEDATSPGELFVTDAATVLTGSNDTIEIRSFEGGPDFALKVNDQLTITEPVIGVEQVVTVTAIVENPTASETIDAYRQAILDAIQLEPQGGAKTDYRLWAADAPGVRKVYPYVKSGAAGTVQVYVEATKEDGSDDFGTPTQAILDSLYLDELGVLEFDPDETKPTNERGRRPIQTILELLPINLVPVDVTITDLDDNTATIQAAILSNLESYLKDVRPYISGADLPRNKNDILYAARLQAVVTDVIDVGNFFTDFTMEVDGVVSTSTEFEGGNIPYLRNLTFD